MHSVYTLPVKGLDTPCELDVFPFILMAIDFAVLVSICRVESYKDNKKNGQGVFQVFPLALHVCMFIICMTTFEGEGLNAGFGFGR